MRQISTILASLVLTFLAALPIQAQTETSAFYIYQNDGRFDGFFYDEVEKIRYSVIDTLGIEHDEVVSQEIVTADSTYRIMLSAIDSVSFVQPELKVNPRLRDMRKEGMLAYLIQKDEEAMTLIFSGSLPVNLHPKVGDVLVDFSPEDLENSFGGKVKSVSTSGNITVVCGHLESIHDIFEQYVTVEQYGKDDEGNLVRRRVAGMPEMTIGTFSSKRPSTSEGSVEFNLFNFAVSGHYPVYSSPEGDVNISIDADVNVKMDVKAVWDFPMFGPDYLSITTTLNNDIGLGFTLDGKINDIYPLGLVPGGGIPVPANMPLFVINFGPDIFIGGEYHAKLNFQTPKYKGKLWGRLEFSGDFSKPKMTFGRGTPPGEQEPDLAEEAENNNWSGSIEFNGFEQCGVKTEFSFGASKLLSWALDTKVDFTTYIGPKVSGALNFSISNVIQDQMSVYNLLKDTKLTFSPLGASYSAEATLGTLFSGQKKWTLADGSWNLLGDIDLYLFPEFNLDVSAKQLDATSGMVDFSVTPSRNILWPTVIGIGLFDGDNMIGCFMSDEAEKPMPAYSSFDSFWRKNQKWEESMWASAGEYEARPIFKIGGFNIVASPAKQITIPGGMIKVIPDTLRLEGDALNGSFKIKTNCTNITSKEEYGYTLRHPWLSSTVNENAVELRLQPNHTVVTRNARVVLTGQYQYGNSSVEIKNWGVVEQEGKGDYNYCQIDICGLNGGISSNYHHDSDKVQASKQGKVYNMLCQEPSVPFGPVETEGIDLNVTVTNESTRTVNGSVTLSFMRRDENNALNVIKINAKFTPILLSHIDDDFDTYVVPEDNISSYLETHYILSEEINGEGVTEYKVVNTKEYSKPQATGADYLFTFIFKHI